MSGSSFCPCGPRLLVYKENSDNGIKPFKYVVDGPVLVELDVDDDNLGGVDTNRHCCAVRFIALYTVNVNDPFLAVHLRNLSFSAFVFPAHNSDLVVLTDRQ